MDEIQLSALKYIVSYAYEHTLFPIMYIYNSFFFCYKCNNNGVNN